MLYLVYGPRGWSCSNIESSKVIGVFRAWLSKTSTVLAAADPQVAFLGMKP